MKLTYLGHSAFILESNNFKGIIDPFISGNPQTNIKVDDIKGLTHIFVSHGHSDHMGDTEELARRNDVLIISNAEISNYLTRKGLKTHGMHIGGKHTFDFGTVKLTPALHGSAIQTDEGTVDGGNPCGFLIEIDDKKIYHAGDTGLTMDMKLLEMDDIDVALLPIGGNYTMDLNDALRAVEFIKPKISIPMHYNTFPLIKANPEEFKKKNKESNTVVLSIGETYEF